MKTWTAWLGLGKNKDSVIEEKIELIGHRGNRKDQGRYLSRKLQQGKPIDQRMKANKKGKYMPGGEIYNRFYTKGGEIQAKSQT
jgi:hypothetical protein